MPRIRAEDLLRHFGNDMVQVVGAEAGRRREERTARRAEEREDRELEMRLAQLQTDAEDRRYTRSRNAASDKRAARDQKLQEETAARNRTQAEFEAENPWTYNGMRFPTKEARDQAREQDLRTSASITAANRAPREDDDSPTSTSRTRASAQGDLQRWYSRNRNLSPENAERYLRSIYGNRLTAGEISGMVEEVRQQYNPSNSNRRRTR